MSKSKYEPLKNYLADLAKRGQRKVSLSFEKVESILGFPLCESAYGYRQWWENSRSHSQAKAWLDAGWETGPVDMRNQIVTFKFRGQSNAGKSDGKQRYNYLEETEHTEEGLRKEDILIIVACTKRKIWDEDPSQPTYVPAVKAYRGETVTWLRNNVPEEKGFHCVILSAKYGFIELEHPIGYYNVTFANKGTGPISDESLRNQVHYQCRRFGNRDIRLCEFKYVFVKTGNRDKEQDKESYINKVRGAFTKTKAEGNVKRLDNKLWGQILHIVDP